jgi:hypothetical protein
MHKNKPSKHKPVLVKKPRNPVVAALLTNPKRNAGKHTPNRADLTMLEPTDKE